MGRAINTVRRCSLSESIIMLTLHQSPFDLFDRLDQQLATAERVPHAEVIEGEAAYIVRLELPGVDRDSIDVKATERTLVVSAERQATNAEAKKEGNKKRNEESTKPKERKQKEKK